MARLHERCFQPNDPSAIFSPSVARTAASVARDWRHIETWLMDKLPSGRPPPYERNERTLQILLALASANEAADEEQHLLTRAEAVALQHPDIHQHAGGSQVANHENAQVMNDLLTAIRVELPKEGKVALDSLAEIAVRAEVALAKPEELEAEIVRLQGSIFETEQTVARFEFLGCLVEREADQAAELLQSWNDPLLRPAPEAAKLNLEMQRKTSTIRAQVNDLQGHTLTTKSAITNERFTIHDLVHDEQDLLALNLTKEYLTCRSHAGLSRRPRNND